MPGAADVILILFLFALGASLGSFLNVVVLRMPGNEPPAGSSAWAALRHNLRVVSHPPSHCPRCKYVLRWHDNFPVLGWLWLRGRCRGCALPISPRYPLVEALVGLLFAGYYVAFFIAGPAWGPPTPAATATVVIPHADLPPPPPIGPLLTSDVLIDLIPPGALPGLVPADAYISGQAMAGPIVTVAARAQARLDRDWPLFAVALLLVWCLVAASCVDLEHYVIPRWLSYLPAIVALPVHALAAAPGAPLTLLAGPTAAAWGLAGFAGWVLALLLVSRGWMRRSFAEDMPLLEVERERLGQREPTPPEIAAEARLVRRETLREVGFLALPLGLGLAAALLVTLVAPIGAWWQGTLSAHPWLAGLAGSMLGGLVGAGVIWGVRILGNLGFGRESMGLGDVDLMFGVGCVLGGGPAALALPLAAFAGLAFAVYRWAARGRHELPFGPYLAAGTLLGLIVYNPVVDYLRPGLEGLALLMGPGISSLLGL